MPVAASLSLHIIPPTPGLCVCAPPQTGLLGLARWLPPLCLAALHWLAWGQSGRPSTAYLGCLQGVQTHWPSHLPVLQPGLFVVLGSNCATTSELIRPHKTPALSAAQPRMNLPSRLSLSPLKRRPDKEHCIHREVARVV